MNGRDARTRHLVIFLTAAPAAAICWFVFHAVYQSLTLSVKAVGYVDSTTQIGIALGYAVMVGGTLLLAIVALRSGITYLLLLRRNR
ncbi:MAG TPA: hypothetical protein VEW74_08590 [Candidatus Nitrosotalea sp.]|nr:hypothetical protein [Candidatus Nitrosotalea sp.]